MLRPVELRRAAVCAALSLGAGALAACTLLVSTSDLATSAGSPRSDGAAEDAILASDAAVDGGGEDVQPRPPVVDSGSPLSFCANLSPAPVFCADFDDGRPLSALGMSAGSSPTIDTTVGRSGNASLLLDIPTSPTDSFQRGIDTPVGGSFTSYAVSCAVRMAPSVTAAYTQIVSFRFASGTVRYSFVLVIDNGRIQLAEEHGPTGTEAPSVIGDAPLPSTPSGWVTIRFAGTLGSAAARAQLYAEGMKVDDQPLSSAPSAPGTGADVIYGVYYSGPNQPAKRFNLDDVVVDLH